MRTYVRMYVVNERSKPSVILFSDAELAAVRAYLEGRPDADRLEVAHNVDGWSHPLTDAELRELEG